MKHRKERWTTYTWGFICLSTLLRLLGVPPEFITILVSSPVYMTTPITHAVFRNTVPRRSVICISIGKVSCSWTASLSVFDLFKSRAAFSLYMFTSGLSQSNLKVFAMFAQSAAVRRCVSDGTALRDFKLVSPSRFFVSTKATFSSSEVAQMSISAGNDSWSLILTKSPTRTSSHIVFLQCGFEWS